MIHPCPSCGTPLKVSSAAAVARAKCPRCGSPLGVGAEGPVDTAARQRRGLLVIGGAVACLGLLLVVTLVLLSNLGGGDEAKAPDTRLAQGSGTLAPAPPAPPVGSPVHVGPGQHQGGGELTPAHLPPPVAVLPTPEGDPRPTTAPRLLDEPPDTPPPVKVEPQANPIAKGEGDKKGSLVDVPAPPPTTKIVQVMEPAPKQSDSTKSTSPVVTQVAKGPTQQISFLGSVAVGRRFCIIADNSSSMRGTPLDTVKWELARTLQSITRDSAFYVIFFNSQPVPQPSPGWLRGVDGLPAVMPWIAAIPSTGGTQPTPAFNLALRLNPPPDAIFFMTDGAIPTSVPDQVAVLNQHTRVPIHTILFSKINPRTTNPATLQRAAGGLQRIAAQSNGTFRAVPVPPNPPGGLRLR